MRLILFITISLLGTYCIGQPKPSITNSGFYEDSLEVVMSSVSGQIRYTTDGSEPNSSSTLYTGPFTLYPDTSDIVISNIPTNPSFNYPMGKYDSTRAMNRGWVQPYSKHNKAHVIRAKWFLAQAESEEVIASYFINTNNGSGANYPIVSLIISSDYLFSDSIGIYVFGDHEDGNYNNRGEEWEREAYIEIFNQTEDLVYSDDIDLRTHGGGGRHSAQKALRVYADDEIKHGLFEGAEEQEFKRLLIRGGGHRPDCISRDDVAGAIVENMGLDHQRFKQCILYINGEYWGIHSLKERIDKYYVESHYSIDKDEVGMVTYGGTLEEGIAEDSLHYQMLLDLANNLDLSDSANYALIKEYMDVENYIDYQLAEIFFANGDWVNSNIRIWKRRIIYNQNEPSGRDGRWRWAFFDLDGGFGGSCSDVFVTMNGLKAATSTSASVESATRLFRNLLENENFENEFIQRSMDMMNSSFLPNRTRAIYSDLTGELDKEMLSHINRWRYPSTASTLTGRLNETPSLNEWEFLRDGIDDFLNRRKNYMIKHFNSYFGEVDTNRLTLDVSDDNAGYIQVNRLNVKDGIDGVENGMDVYPWSGDYYDEYPISLKAIPYPGYKFLGWSDTASSNASRVFFLSEDSSLVANFGVDSTYTAPQNQLRINEVMSSNKTTIADEYGDYDDYVELYNLGTNTIDLSGFYLSDDGGNLKKYQIPDYSTVKIEPKGFQIIWADDDTEQGPLHTSFKLKKSGEAFYISTPDCEVLDSIIIPALTSDNSYGRVTDGIGEYDYIAAPTPNASNSSVGISEINQPEINIFPNPASNFFYIDFKGQEGVYQVIDLSGKVLKEAVHNGSILKIDTSNYKSGVYTVSVKTQKGVFSKRLVVLRK